MAVVAPTPVIPANAGIQAGYASARCRTAFVMRDDLGPGFRPDDGIFHTQRVRQHDQRPHFPPGCVTVSTAGATLPTPRNSGRYMSSTSDGGTVYVPGVTARTR